MSLACVYRVTDQLTMEMKVVRDDEFETLTQSGEWFSHPEEAKESAAKAQINAKKKKGSLNEE